MLIWFLGALVLFALAMLLSRRARHQEAHHKDGGRPLPPPTTMQPAPPDRRIDLDDLEPHDVVEIETATGARYRFRRERERDVFTVEIPRGEGWQQAFRATVVASFRQQTVFPRTFALGCSLHIIVQQDAGPAPKRIQMLTTVRHLRGRDNPRLN